VKHGPEQSGPCFFDHFAAARSKKFRDLKGLSPERLFPARRRLHVPSMGGHRFAPDCTDLINTSRVRIPAGGVHAVTSFRSCRRDAMVNFSGREAPLLCGNWLSDRCDLFREQEFESHFLSGSVRANSGWPPPHRRNCGFQSHRDGILAAIEAARAGDFALALPVIENRYRAIPRTRQRPIIISSFLDGQSTG